VIQRAEANVLGQLTEISRRLGEDRADLRETSELDLQGGLRAFALPRTNPYLLNVMAWEARNGWLTTNI
jgi:hypothetical protein